MESNTMVCYDERRVEVGYVSRIYARVGIGRWRAVYKCRGSQYKYSLNEEYWVNIEEGWLIDYAIEQFQPAERVVWCLLQVVQTDV